MFITDVTLDAIYAHKLSLKFTAVSVEFIQNRRDKETAIPYCGRIINTTVKYHLCFFCEGVDIFRTLSHSAVKTYQQFQRLKNWDLPEKMFHLGVFSFSYSVFNILFLFISSASSITAFLGVNVKISDC
jgi:hypothetical protein